MKGPGRKPEVPLGRRFWSSGAPEHGLKEANSLSGFPTPWSGAWLEDIQSRSFCPFLRAGIPIVFPNGYLISVTPAEPIVEWGIKREDQNRRN